MRVSPETSCPCHIVSLMRSSPFALTFSVLIALCLAVPAARGQAAASPGTAAAQRRAGGGGAHEGVTVHGHWVIEVRKPDGKLVSHTEFENSLLPGGPISLSQILSRQLSVGFWSVLLFLSPSAQVNGEAPACTATTASTTGAPSSCFITEPQVSLTTGQIASPIQLAGCTPTSNCSNDLQILFANLTNTSFSISGTVSAAQPGYIDSVVTTLSTCGGASGNGSSNYSACIAGTLPGGDYIYEFSGATLPAPSSGQCGGTGQISCAVNVPEAGDTITATISYSFQ